MAHRLQDTKIAILATDGVEQVELIEPRKAVEAEGATVELLSLQAGDFRGFDHLDQGETFTADRAVADAGVGDYDGLILPGGVANPDFLRADPDAVAFVRDFVASSKPVGVICHGPWTLVEADVLGGRTVTSWPSLQTDIRNAGGEWVDEEVHVDGKLITSRKPDDLPAFCAALVDALSAVAAGA